MPHVARAEDLAARTAESGLPYLDAVTPRHGATRVYAAIVRVPPGGRSIPHYHVATETILYQTRGRVKTYFGPALEEVVETGPGDFLFIKPGEVHQAVNDSDEWAEAIVFRDSEHEAVVEVAARRDA